MRHTQEYLDTLSKQQRGELWIQSVLEKEPDYNVQDLRDIWDQTENTCETYEQEADKIKWMDDKLIRALNSGYVEYNSWDDLIADVEKLGEKILSDKQKVISKTA